MAVNASSTQPRYPGMCVAQYLPKSTPGKPWPSLEVAGESNLRWPTSITWSRPQSQ
ncbi:hypothetical protein E2C01_085394 [Portunus trituberculatus]|uniref:Uncharacterized protein n=1 Tax=Portunus trituberculatus TaxID=210409 RepID=A0A5B7JAC6_PORTR|nr:hypothetical protein [Portunus trituberculatus]